MSSTFSLTNKTRGTLPRLPFKKIKDIVLGPRYDLSCAFLSSTQMKEAMKYRYKDSAQGGSALGRKVSNVLSFPLSKHSGEILICPSAAKPYTVGYLFIHGVLHLKGLKHGATMENAEHKLLVRFHICKKLSQA